MERTWSCRPDASAGPLRAGCIRPRPAKMAAETEATKTTTEGDPAHGGPPPRMGIYVLSDIMGPLGVWDDVETAKKAIEGHKGAVVGHAWPRHGSGETVWVIPGPTISSPPAFVSDSRDHAMVTHHALAQVGAAPECGEVDRFAMKLNSLTPMGEIRMNEQLRKWSKEDKDWVRKRFAALQGQEPLTNQPAGVVACNIAELIVRPDREIPPPGKGDEGPTSESSAGKTEEAGLPEE